MHSYDCDLAFLYFNGVNVYEKIGVNLRNIFCYLTVCWLFVV